MIPAKFLVALSEWATVNRCSIEMRFNNPLQIEFNINWHVADGRDWGQRFITSVPELARLRNIDTEYQNWLALTLESIAMRFANVRADFQTLMIADVPKEVLRAVRLLNPQTLLLPPFRIREPDERKTILIRGEGTELHQFRIEARRLYYGDADLTDEIGKDYAP